MHTRQFLATFLSFFVLSLSAFAQSGIVSGSVTDSLQNLSLPGASLKLTPGNRSTISNEYGKFAFLDVPAGKYTLSVTYIGYKISTREIEVTASKATAINVAMEDGTVIGTEVLVLGDRLRGQAKAINQQKNNLNITNIVSSDQVGRFPDANIGDAIKRIPGITMQNDQGEARNIIVRGIAPELNSVTLNGDRIPSAEGDNRRVQMDLIPSDMIQTIEVNKTLTPDMDADAIGGSVNLVTRASPNGQRISATLSSGYNPIREKAIYNGGLVYGNRFFNKKLGVVISGSINSNDYGSDNVEAVWKKDDFNNVYIEEQDIRKYDVKRVRRSVSAALDYKINEKNRLTANMMYNWRDDLENRYRWRATNIEPEYDAADNITGFTGDIRRETKGGIDNSRNEKRRLEEQRVQNYSLRGDHLVGNKMNIDWSVAYSKASEYRPNERYIEYEAEGVSFAPAFGDSRYPLVAATTAPQTSAFALRTISENTDNTSEDELGMRLNFRIPFSVINDQKGRLRFGGRLRLKSKDRNNSFNEYSPLGAGFDNLSEASTVNWSGAKWNPDSKYTPGTFASNTFLGQLALNNPALFEAESIPAEFLSLNYHANETIVAGYVRWDQSFTDKLSMILGARIESTSLKYSG
ncbi:MAG: carboxypeptidase-like regulatory domain-containing protein, partial [Flavitalea sp.]